MRVVVLGAERLGRVLALDLLQAGHEVRLLEQRRELLAALPPGFEGRAIHGSPLPRTTLADAVVAGVCTGLSGMAIAGITRAHGLKWALLLLPVASVYLGGVARPPRLGRNQPKMA